MQTKSFTTSISPILLVFVGMFLAACLNSAPQPESNARVEEGFSISKQHLSKKEFIYNWSSVDGINKIIQRVDNCKIVDENERYIQIETTNARNYIEMDTKAFDDKLVKYKSIFTKYKYGAFSLGLSLFISFFRDVRLSHKLALRAQSCIATFGFTYAPFKL